MSSVIDIRPGLRALLLADATVTALVGARIYPGQMPQGVNATSLVYTEVSVVADHHMQGASGLAQTRIQIDAWSPNPDTADELGRAVQTALDGYRGTLTWGSNSPPDSVVVRGVFLAGGRAVYENDTKLYGNSRDYIVHFAER